MSLTVASGRCASCRIAPTRELKPRTASCARRSLPGLCSPYPTVGPRSIFTLFSDITALFETRWASGGVTKMFPDLVRALSVALFFIVASTDLSHAAPVKTTCGAPIQSIVLTQTQSAPHFETSSTSFVRLTGAVLNIVVPAQVTRCVKVRFTGRVSCQGNGGNATCYLRALAKNVEMNPGAIGESDVRFSYEWISRLEAGTNQVQIQARRIADNSGAIIRIDDWVMDIEIFRAASSQ